MSDFKRVLKELIPYKRNLVIVASTGILMAATQSFNVAMTKELGDSLQGKNLDRLLEVSAIMLGLALVAGVTRYFHLYLMNYTGEVVIQNMRHQLQKKFMNLSLAFHNNYSAGSGGLISRILNDIVIIKDGLRMFADFFREPITLIALLGWLFYLDWKLTFAIFIILPLILIFLRQISRTIKTYSIKGLEDFERIASVIKESLDGVRIIQSFNLEKEMSQRFEKESEEYLKSRRKIHQRVEMSGPVSEFVITGVVLGITIYIGSEIAQNRATFGDFVGYLAALLGLSPPVKKLQESYVRTQETLAAARRVFQIIDENSEVPQISSGKKFPENWDKIHYKNVTFSYGNHLVLKNINLEIKRGQIVALVGASGSGKSTLVNLLERFFDPTQGGIYLDNIELREMDLKSLRHHIALVTQDVFLFSDSIERNIWAGDFSKNSLRVEDVAKAANAHDFIMRTPKGYQTRVGDRGNLLSGGEKQRISIARALFKDAPILILDEATSALDSVSEIEVQKGLDRLMEGRTTLVIAHRLSTVMKADRIVVLRNGEIVETGKHDELLKLNGEYTRLYKSQFETNLLV